MWNREEILFHLQAEDVVLAGLTDRPTLEAVVVTKNGTVCVKDIESRTHSEVGRLTFDPTLLNLQLHAFQNFICITQKHGTLGTVFNLADGNYLQSLERGDYCAQVCKFPIALYSDDGHTFLIHGTDWNRLDITCLDSNELLTPRIVDYDTDSNYFDYFHSSLLVAPDAKSFSSNGWHWHPYGQITVYSIDKFLSEFECSHTDLVITDASDPEDTIYELEWDRPLCWIDNQTLGIGYNRGVGHHGQRKFPWEILIHDLVENRTLRRIPFDIFAVGTFGDIAGELYFDSQSNHFVGIDEKNGILITEANGNVVLKDGSFSGYKYDAAHRVFFRFDKNSGQMELIRFEPGKGMSR